LIESGGSWGGPAADAIGGSIAALTAKNDKSAIIFV
jgi:hypothetical protein